MSITPAIRAFLDDLHALVDRKRSDWPTLDADVLASAMGHDTARIVLAHSNAPDRNVELEVSDATVKVAYGPEHQVFTSRDEALRFIEMLGDGRVTLVVTRRIAWNVMKSYRDGLALPFAKSTVPWLNLRPRTDTLAFGFGS